MYVIQYQQFKKQYKINIGVSPSGKAQDFIGSSKGKAREVQAEGGSVPLPMAMTPACEGSNPSTPAKS